MYGWAGVGRRPSLIYLPMARAALPAEPDEKGRENQGALEPAGLVRAPPDTAAPPTLAPIWRTIPR